MKSPTFGLALCLLLVLFVATPMALYAAGTLTTVYADGTGTAGNGTGPLGSATNPVRIRTQADFNTAIALLVNQTGDLVHIFDAGGPRWCKYTITNGAWSPPRDCTPGLPPETGEPIASSLYVVAVGAIALLLVTAGLFLRSRSPAKV